tara:strand:- start:143 stop:298 length:156 start_codon:yes stop_codon:yes gene_type:complete
VSLKKEEIEKRIREIPTIITKLTEECNQLLGYLKCLEDLDTSPQKNKKEKK